MSDDLTPAVESYFDEIETALRRYAQQEISNSLAEQIQCEIEIIRDRFVLCHPEYIKDGRVIVTQRRDGELHIRAAVGRIRYE